MKKCSLLLLVLLVFSVAGVDQLTITPSSWIVKQEGSSEKPLFFNKLAFDGYFTLGRVKLFASVPLALSNDPEDDSHQFGIGDVQIYAGIPLGIIEPRVGLITPGAYSTDGDKAWIGSQDFKAGIGFALKPHRNRSQGFLFSLESMSYFYLAEKPGFGKPGGVDLQSIIKGSYFFTSGLKLNLETLVNMSAVEWEWNPKDTKTVDLTLVPVVSASKNVGSRIDLGVKAGAGPTFRALGDADVKKHSTNISLGIYIDLSL